MRRVLVLLLFMTGLAACGRFDAPPATVTPLFATPTDAPAALPTPVPPLGATPTPRRTPAPATTPAPSPAGPSLSLGVDRAAVARELAETAPPLRDDVRLAVAYRGIDAAVATPPAPSDLAVGDTETFTIGNVDSNTVSQITAELLSIGDNAYFWFDTAAEVQPDATELKAVTSAFDSIYDTLYATFGVSPPPGGRVHVVHASAAALCDDPDACRLAGYFSSRDLLPAAVNPLSNERPMFVMNVRQYGTENYLDVLSHELRHMLGSSYDTGDEDWFIEGAAMLAEDLVGFTLGPQARGGLFLANPDQQLNSWTDENTIPYYGQGYLVNRFLYDRLGPAVYREYSRRPEPGLQAVDAAAAAAGRDETGESLWLDWLVAMAIQDNDAAPERYRWDGPDLEPLTPTAVDRLPAQFATTVSQYAADYYALPSSGEFRIDFNGAASVSLLGADAPSGDHFWYAQRANESNPRLTRSVDLRSVDAATLTYRVYADIERGYDFAYVSVSTDGGERWQPLVAANMHGLDTADDPSNTAFADRFYTGRSRTWLDESIDLTPYAGAEILLRFEYVTDLILTYGGFALDDIAIPEIGFDDDVETAGAGWTAEGFTRATGELPQEWRLQLVTFDRDGQPAVDQVPVEDGHAVFSFQAVAGRRRPLLIIAALAPETLQPAAYSLRLSGQ